MRKSTIYILFCLLLVITACSKNHHTFEAKPIVKTIGNIDVIVDPNVEMMMIIGRLAGLQPYSLTYPEHIPYLDSVDEHFKNYKSASAVTLARKNALTYCRLPEFGMYLNEDNSDFVMSPDNENFITTDDGPAKNLTYYTDDTFRKAVRDFRITSGFDAFFIENKATYEQAIEQSFKVLGDKQLDVWLKEFYGTETKEKPCLYLTSLTSGGNFGISFKKPDGEVIPHSVVMTNQNEYSFLFLVSHEFSHPMTKKASEELYKNADIQTLFDNLYTKYAFTYKSNGYASGKTILIETINQACANKFLEKTLPESVMEYLNTNEITERQKMIYVPEIADFLETYEENREKYKVFNDFIPVLEKFLRTNLRKEN